MVIFFFFLKGSAAVGHAHLFIAALLLSLLRLLAVFEELRLGVPDILGGRRAGGPRVAFGLAALLLSVGAS